MNKLIEELDIVLKKIWKKSSIETKVKIQSFQRELSEDFGLALPHETAICPNCEQKTLSNNIEYLGDEKYNCDKCKK